MAEAIEQGDFPRLVIERNGQSYSWPNFDDMRSNEQRVIERNIRSLGNLDVENRRAQRALRAAIRALEKAQLALQEEHEAKQKTRKEAKLAGGIED